AGKDLRGVRGAGGRGRHADGRGGAGRRGERLQERGIGSRDRVQRAQPALQGARSQGAGGRDPPRGARRQPVQAGLKAQEESPPVATGGLSAFGVPAQVSRRRGASNLTSNGLPTISCHCFFWSAVSVSAALVFDSLVSAWIFGM